MFHWQALPDKDTGKLCQVKNIDLFGLAFKHNAIQGMILYCISKVVTKSSYKWGHRHYAPNPVYPSVELRLVLLTIILSFYKSNL